jgi:hypothetical protein
MSAEESPPAIRISATQAKRRSLRRPAKRVHPAVVVAILLGSLLCFGVLYAVSFQPRFRAIAWGEKTTRPTAARRKQQPSKTTAGSFDPQALVAGVLQKVGGVGTNARPAPHNRAHQAPAQQRGTQSSGQIRESNNDDGTYTLELPKGRFQRVMDPQAFTGPPPRQDGYDANKYLTSDETEAGNRSIARQKAEQEVERTRNEAMIRDWENTISEAKEANRRREASAPSQAELKAEYEAAYERGYADAAYWVRTIERDTNRNANRMVIENEIRALNTVLENYASLHLKLQREVEGLVQAYGPGKRNKYAVALERTRGGYEGAKAAAGRFAR